MWAGAGGALGMAERAFGPFGAKASEVFSTRLLARVPVSAALPMLAEAPCKPRAIVGLLVGPYVKEDALLVPALAKRAKVEALRHAVMIEAVQEVAQIALFAQAAKPVLAHDLVPPRIQPDVCRRGRRLLEPENLVEVDVEQLVHRPTRPSLLASHPTASTGE